MIILIPDGGNVCQHCGKVYNQYLGDRFWAGGDYPCNDPEECENDGGVHDVVCDDCHRDLVRERDRR